MSHYYSPKIYFKHSNPCTHPTLGCKGHEIYLDYASTYDAVHVIVDGKISDTFDENLFHAIIELSKMPTDGKPK